MPLILIVIAQKWNLFHHFFKKMVRVADLTKDQYKQAHKREI